MRYICIKHGMYPTNKKDIYKAERIVDVITTDCQFHNEEYALLVLNQQ
jgi:hypothetical protein